MSEKKGLECEICIGHIHIYDWFKYYKSKPEMVASAKNITHCLDYIQQLSRTEVLVFDPTTKKHQIVDIYDLYVITKVIRYDDVKEFINYQLKLDFNEPI